MASAKSGISKVTTGTSVRNRRENFYQTEVTTLADGSVKRETFRTDKNGNNSVKISEVTADKDGNITNDTTLSTASKEERRSLQNPNSQLRNSIRQQTKEAGDKAQANSIDPGGALEKSGGGSGNTATDQETGDSQATTTSSPSSTRDFGDMQYPATIAEGQDTITFTALTYAVKTLEGFTFGGRERVGPGGGGGRSKGTVTLPIQSGIKDQNAAGWGEDKMTAGDIAKAGVALKTIMEGGGGFSESIGTLANQAVGSSEDLATAVGTKFAENAAGVKGLLARTQGKVMNPNLELLFDKPTLRPFSFQFKLSARNKEEAATIVKIIRFFKQNMAPQKGGGSGGTSANLFLKAPNTFQIHYMHEGSKEHPYIGRAKECAMTSFEVDYTPDGNYSTLKDGFMTSYTISMSLKELEPVFYEDYDDIPEDQIGF
jgi:hypothetical protein